MQSKRKGYFTLELSQRIFTTDNISRKFILSHLTQHPIQTLIIPFGITRKVEKFLQLR
jgi:hypothetical protein